MVFKPETVIKRNLIAQELFLNFVHKRVNGCKENIVGEPPHLKEYSMIYLKYPSLNGIVIYLKYSGF